MKTLFVLLGVYFSLGVRAQLHVDAGAVLFLDSGAVITVQSGVDGWILAGTRNLTLSDRVFPVGYQQMYLGRPGVNVIKAGGDLVVPEMDLLRVWPNPAKDGFFVDTRGKCVLELYDAGGRLVKSKEVNAAAPAYFELDSRLAKGVYLLRIRRGGALEATKSVFVR